MVACVLFASDYEYVTFVTTSLSLVLVGVKRDCLL